MVENSFPSWGAGGVSPDCHSLSLSFGSSCYIYLLVFSFLCSLVFCTEVGKRGWIGAIDDHIFS